MFTISDLHGNVISEVYGSTQEERHENLVAALKCARQEGYDHVSISGDDIPVSGCES